uniref:Secreted protein n=1 Tax=Panagrellus redivivus TaxID=6233 RepID=A0A7E4US69_PANRE
MWCTYNTYRSFLSAPKTPMHMKRKLINMVLMPTALYGPKAQMATRNKNTEVTRQSMDENRNKLDTEGKKTERPTTSTLE